MDRQLQAFIFDLDGVITDTAEYHYLAWKALAEQLNIVFTREFNEELKGISRMDSLEKILILGGIERHFSIAEKISLANKKNEHYQQLIQKITPADILPGIEVLLSDIRERGLKIGLASASKNADTVMDALELKGYFDVIVDANTIINSKPDPEIFLRAAELLNVAPHACIGIEDAAAGIEAINGAEMFAVGVGNREVLAKADLVVENTSELNFDTIVKVFKENF